MMSRTQYLVGPLVGPGTPEHRRFRLAYIGNLIYGERWQNPMAAALEYDQSTLSKIAAGHRPVPADLEARVAELCRNQSRINRQIAELLDIAVEQLLPENEGPMP